MAPIAVPTPQPQVVAAAEREVLRCEHCKLVQFRTANDVCRKCRKSLLPELPKVQPIAIAAEP